MSSNVIVPQPFSVKPSGKFYENDGSWSTFNLAVGAGGTGSTGVQNFEAIISTSGYEVWLPPAFPPCNNSNPSKNGTQYRHFPPQGCDVARGVGLFQGIQSSGYQANESSSVASTASTVSESLTLGPYSPLQIFGTQFNDTGYAYQDNITLNSQLSANGLLTSAERVPVYGVPNLQFFLPTLGIAPGVQETATGLKVPSALLSWNSSGAIPGLSWGYTAGQKYNNRFASLTLGGYDKAQIQGNTARFNMTDASALSLRVSSIGLTFTNSSGTLTTTAPSSPPFTAVIDATLPYLFLPNATVDWLKSKLRLYEFGYALYYNLSDPQSVASRTDVDTFQFSLDSGGSSADGSSTQSSAVSIRLPRVALEANASWTYDFMNNTVYLVPIRRAPSSVAVLGRSFLQEAYISADFEKKMFNVSQAAPGPFTGNDIVPLYNQRWLGYLGQPTITPTPTATPTPPGGLSGGAIAGIVVGSVLGGLFIFALLLWLCFLLPRRKKRQEKEQREAEEKAAMEEAQRYKSPELDGSEYYSHRASMTSDATTLAGGGIASRPSQRTIRRFSELSSDSETEGTRPGRFADTLGPLAEMEHKSDAAELDAIAAHEAQRPTFELDTNAPSGPSPLTPEMRHIG